MIKANYRQQSPEIVDFRALVLLGFWFVPLLEFLEIVFVFARIVFLPPLTLDVVLRFLTHMLPWDC